VAQLAGFENVFDAEVTSIHEERGTMMCKVTAPNSERARLPAVPTNHEEIKGTTEVARSRGDESAVASAQIELETPLVRAEAGTKLRVGISAGDVLLATSAPVGLSARNILSGKVLSLWQRDMVVVARVDCGVEMSVHLTLAARDSLQLTPGRQVWLIVKTHSCHLLA